MIAPAAHHPSATNASEPTCAPSVRSRSVFTIGVTGWFSAIQRSPDGIVSGGTSALERYGAKAATNVSALAVSTLLTSSPNDVAIHEIATIRASSRPAAASQRNGSATGRNPQTSATP